MLNECLMQKVDEVCDSEAVTEWVKYSTLIVHWSVITIHSPGMLYIVV